MCTSTYTNRTISSGHADSVSGSFLTYEPDNFFPYRVSACPLRTPPPASSRPRRGDPGGSAGLWQCLAEGMRVAKATRQAPSSWKVPPAAALKVVELRGIEPLTPRLPASCSPS
jgi:hypothetical protein